jgi:hypothetical protein
MRGEKVKGERRAVDVARVVVVARWAQSDATKWIAVAVRPRIPGAIVRIGFDEGRHTYGLLLADPYVAV